MLLFKNNMKYICESGQCMLIQTGCVIMADTVQIVHIEKKQPPLS